VIVRRNRRGEPNHFVYPLSRKKHPATQRRMVTISAKIEDEDDDEGREDLRFQLGYLDLSALVDRIGDGLNDLHILQAFHEAGLR